MKAQIWSMDFVVSVLLFFITLGLLFFAWNYTNYKSTEQIMFNNAERMSLTASDSLIRTPGVPDDWNLDNVISIGLVDKEYVINETKAAMFLGMDYGEARDMLLDVSYDFYFEMSGMNGDIISINGTNATKGSYPGSGASNVIPAKRYAVYNGGIVEISFMLWN